MSIKKAEAHLEAMVANIGRLEAVMAKVTAADLETMRVNPEHRLPDELRSQMIYYVSVIAEGARNIIGTPSEPGLAPDWFTGDVAIACKLLIGLRNIMLHGYAASADDRQFWSGINGPSYQTVRAAVMRLAQQYL